MINNEKKFIIDVIPLTRIPLSRQQYFSYEWSQKLPTGTLVSIPLFRRILNGVVIKSRSDFERLGNIQLKKIINVLEENFLTEQQLKLAEFISDYYLSPLGTVLKFFVPKRVISRSGFQKRKAGNLKKITKLTEAQQLAVNEIIKNNSQEKILLFGPSSAGKTEVYIHSMLETRIRDKKSQFLTLLPELTLTPQTASRYAAYFNPEEIAIIHSKISKGELFSNWQKIKSGEAKIIIGTRMAVLAPFKNLKMTVIDEEQDMSFKQWDMNPRYDARTVAMKLSEIHKAKIIFSSATPSIESYFKALKGEYQLLELPKLKLPATKYQIPNTQIEIVDMRRERWVKNYSPISKKLEAEISFTLKNKGQVILFVNRQGMSSFSVCAGCRTVLRCPKCDRALIFDKEGYYRCLHCPYKTGAIATCPRCKGIIFKNYGIGTQKIEREISRIFPEAKIKRVDLEAMKKRGGTEELYEKFSQGDYDILIGTQMITKGWDNPKVSLIGIIDADNLISSPDFRSAERAYQLIVQAAGRTARIGSNTAGVVIIQTFNPENFVIQKAASLNFQGFYERELDERKDFRYPPFGRLIKLVYQHKDRKKVEKEANLLYNEATRGAGGNKELFVSKPHQPLVGKIRDRWRSQVIIKYQTEIPKPLGKVLERLGSDWIIDVDPIAII